MAVKIHLIAVTLISLSLTACMIDGTNSENSNYAGPTNAPGSTLYPESYETNIVYPAPEEAHYRLESSDKQVVVPESYHVSAYHAPVSFKDSDRSWVSNQNPQAYTIQLVQGDKPAQVANVLTQAPKGEHTAEVAYQRGSKTYYKGFYGSYPSYEAAQQAYNALPENLRASAGIQTWNSAQSNMQ